MKFRKLCSVHGPHSVQMSSSLTVSSSERASLLVLLFLFGTLVVKNRFHFQVHVEEPMVSTT